MCRENRRWVRDYIVITRKVCEILHDMMIRVMDDGDVVAEDGGDVLMEFLNKEDELTGKFNEEGDEMEAIPTIDLGYQNVY